MPHMRTLVISFGARQSLNFCGKATTFFTLLVAAMACGEDESPTRRTLYNGELKNGRSLSSSSVFHENLG